MFSCLMDKLAWLVILAIVTPVWTSLKYLLLLKDHIEKSLNLRRRLYADEPNEDLVSSLYNLGFLLAQHGDVGNLVRSVELHEEAAETYRKLGGANKNSKLLQIVQSSFQVIHLPSTLLDHPQSSSTPCFKPANLLQ